MKLSEKMNEVLKNDVVDRHSYFQLKYFIIGKEPTLQAKLWRCLTEIRSRKESLDALELEIEDSNDKKQIAEIELSSNDESGDLSDTANKLSIIKSRQIKRKIKSIDASILGLERKKRYIAEEVAFLLSAYDEIEKAEKIRPFDDINSQLEYWNSKLQQELQLKLLLRNPVDVELIKTILVLDNACPVKKEVVKILDTLQKNDRLANNKESAGQQPCQELAH